MDELAQKNEISMPHNKHGLPVFTPHYIRHTYASILYCAGVDVLQAQAWLGHAEAATTLGVYAHLSKEHIAKNHARLDDFFKTLPNDCQTHREMPK